MSVAIFSAVLVALAAPDASTPTPRSPEEQAVRAAFDRYRQALIAKDGPAAVAAVDSKTIAYYDRLLALARTADAKKLRAENLMTRVTVLRLRHDVPPEQLKKMTGKTLLAHAVESGWVSQATAENSELTDVKITGSRAEAGLVANGRVNPTRFGFRKEGGAWRFDLTSIFAAAESAFTAFHQQSGQDEDAFVLGLVEQLSGRKPTADVWNPVR